MKEIPGKGNNYSGLATSNQGDVNFMPKMRKNFDKMVLPRLLGI